MKIGIRQFLAWVLMSPFLAMAQENDFDITIEEETDYNWQTPAGDYLYSSTFFALHGYVNGVFANESKDWTVNDPTQLGPPRQLLAPNTSQSSFQFDFALVMSTELTERSRIMIETHYVSDPSGSGAAGPGGLTIAVTEAAAAVDLIPKYLTLSGGLFWSPFGIVNRDWLGAQNNFSLMPRASGAYPVHFNERGVRLNGYAEIGDQSAINYVFSVGNGVRNFNISGQRSFDYDNNKTFTGRIGIFPGLGEKLNVGISYMNGVLREEGDLTIPDTDPMSYASEAYAFGLDASYNLENIEFRSYFINSNEDLQSVVGPDPGAINRLGFMAEVVYTFDLDFENLKGISPKVRYDFIELDNLEPDEFTNPIISSYSTQALSVGLDLVVNPRVRFASDYNFFAETGQNELENNRFITKIIAQF